MTCERYCSPPQLTRIPVACWCKHMRAICRVRLVIGGPGSIPGRDIFFQVSFIFCSFVCLFACVFICSFNYLFIYFPCLKDTLILTYSIRHVGHSLLNKPILTGQTSKKNHCVSMSLYPKYCLPVSV